MNSMLRFYKIFLINLIWLISFNSISQTGVLSVSGKIIDASTGNPVNGISVSCENFSTTFTDSLGNFKLSVPSLNCEILVKGLDYQTKIVALKGRDNVTVYVNEFNYKSKNEVVNLYYYEKSLLHSNNSVVTINNYDNSWKNPGTSAEELFDDKVSGLYSIKRSGVPGIGANLYLRGFNSLYATNQPLIVVDGFIIDNKQYVKSIINGNIINPLASIDVNDIDNVTFIKDAFASYGSRSANGIVLIRTIHTNEMSTKINFVSYGGINYKPTNIPLLNSSDYKLYLSDLLETSGLSPDSIKKLPYMIETPYVYDDYFRYHNNTNWQDQVFGNSTCKYVNLKITGGDDVALYALSIGYQNNNGIIKNTSLNRYSIRFNSDINISSKVTLNSNLSFNYNQFYLSDEGFQSLTNPLYLSLIKSPFLYPHVISYDGSISPILEDADIFNISNPTALVENMTANNTNYKILGSFNLNYNLTKNLKISNLIGINYDNSRDNLFVPHLGVANDTTNIGIIENTMGHKVQRLFAINNDFRILYSKNFNYKHYLNFILGTRLAINDLEYDISKNYNSPNDYIKSLGSGSNILKTIGGDIYNWRWLTYYITTDYSFKNKYFLTLNFSLDGSSRFGKEAQGMHIFNGTLGTFYSINGAWLVSSENFMSNINFIDLLKLRTSYGITGNDDIGDYNKEVFYKQQNLIGQQGLIKGIIGNPKIKWETSKKFNVGIDLSLFKERISISVDVYRNVTDDMINLIPVDLITGFDYYVGNSGSIKTDGFEIDLYSRVINRKFKWDISFNLSKYKTEVLELPVERLLNQYYGANILTEKGKPLGVFYGYKTLGIFSSQEEADKAGLKALMPNTDLIPFTAGDVHFKDIDGNKIIDENDMQIIGDPNPDFIGMFSNSFSYKGLSLTAVFSFIYGNDVYNAIRRELESGKNFDNQTTAILKRWKYDGQITNVPKVSMGDPIGNSRFSDRWIEDGSYLRLKTLSLSYKIPLKQKILRNFEVFITGQNLITLTKYKGFDPEFSAEEFPLVQGIDIGLTPQYRSFYAGFKLGL